MTSPSVVSSTIADLAIISGTPAFEEPLHVGCPNIGDREAFLARVSDMFDRQWLSNNGPYVRDFEDRLADYLGVNNCIAVANGTIALEIATRALGLSGEMIVPSFSFVATAHALQWQGIRPVFCDIDPATHNLDPAKVEACITPNTSGIVGVHVWGRPCAIGALEDIAARHELALIFDAAHALNCSFNETMIGGFGHAEVFSFHATKFLNTFEGGAIATNNDGLAERTRLMRNFGFAGKDEVVSIGTNGKMSEICAAMGLTGLENLDDVIATNQRNYHLYGSVSENIPGVHQIVYDPTERNNYQYIIWEVDESVTGISRDDLVRLLHAENVLARRYFFPGIHRMEPYRSCYPHAGILLPSTERLTRRVMSLPNGTAIDTEQIRTIGQIIETAVDHGSQITSLLRRWDISTF